MKNKTEISFYHLTTTPILNALPKILEKIISVPKRAIVVLNDEEKMEELNTYLWSFSTKTVIPHGSSKDKYPEEQPVYLTIGKENPNNADVVVIPAGIEYENIDNFEKCLFIFDGNNNQELKQARARWKSYQQDNYNLVYWKQDIRGAWEKVS